MVKSNYFIIDHLKLMLEKTKLVLAYLQIACLLDACIELIKIDHFTKK
jgi:hypothetical protein